MVRVFCLALGYLFGLFQTSYIIGKIHGIDIRDYGSGNAGTTNMMRTLGKKAGLLTFAGDCLKCIFAVLLARFLLKDRYGEILPLLQFYTGAGVILGHNYPFYLGFRGGKGIAATAGLVLTQHPFLIVCGVATFFGCLILTHYVSLSSLLVYVGILVELVILGQGGYLKMAQPALNELYVVAFLLAALAFYKHRDNIKRLLNGTERKAYLFKKKNKD